MYLVLSLREEKQIVDMIDIINSPRLAVSSGYAEWHLGYARSMDQDIGHCCLLSSLLQEEKLAQRIANEEQQI